MNESLFETAHLTGGTGSAGILTGLIKRRRQGDAAAGICVAVNTNSRDSVMKRLKVTAVSGHSCLSDAYETIDNMVAELPRYIAQFLRYRRLHSAIG